MVPEISGPLELSFTKSMVEVVNYWVDDLGTPAVVRSRVPYSLVSSRPRKKSRKNRSTRVHSIVTLSRPYIKYEKVVENNIYAETTEELANLKGEKKMV